MSYTVADVKKLREETGAGMLDCKKALEETKGNFEAAKEVVRKKGLDRADKKADRETKEGYIASYVHSNNKVAVLVEILCETDFVARNEEFQRMAKDVAMHVTAMNSKSVEELLKEPFVKDPSKTIEELVKGISGKTGEKLLVNKLVRFEVGQE
ncbi:MAG: translation elongation factor Ts [Candidatus Pacebacteria bacterium CG1_02_43_31]|nr:translation elongation factor Ts [Candidatus Pacearchaeota archaeon]NCQ65971.1 translation elongation factor Ts [Candidatus Paceibacterota bacterium]OIO43970.1 MAG: translation elongation factor Ts [Candidatus Pacebacteria bacterium CG1_02_43_31]PIQ81189.1 MAG: translation elongation factor Ts [Candidatus Pacebacteria bacterium CG11_big_fil_rev_8_21_14_0_20_34_55]PJC43505.1 MAG: translation elongation factor Ts [Candidatus Pacebacteria bacterium CG_4_9_14_0_2_um_filter_34_50]